MTRGFPTKAFLFFFLFCFVCFLHSHRDQLQKYCSKFQYIPSTIEKFISFHFLCHLTSITPPSHNCKIRLCASSLLPFILWPHYLVLSLDLCVGGGTGAGGGGVLTNDTTSSTLGNKDQININRRRLKAAITARSTFTQE